MSLGDRLRQRAFDSPGQQSMLNVMVTSSWLLGELSAVMAKHGLTPAQYNVLRILRGAHPNAMTCSDIGARLIDRTPDVTRLLDRLERRQLITRTRAEHDRRVVEVRVRDTGLEILRQIEPHVRDVTAQLTGTLSDSEHGTLNHLLDKLRREV